MRKTLVIALCLTAGSAIGANIGVVNSLVDYNGTKGQNFAPNGKKAQSLTVNSVTVDHSNNVAWRVYVSANCKFRSMSTATKAGLARTLPSGGFTSYKNPATPFVNYSGCTSGELDIQ